jgi:putative Mn2+ efflux pump MntP
MRELGMALHKAKMHNAVRVALYIYVFQAVIGAAIGLALPWFLMDW